MLPQDTEPSSSQFSFVQVAIDGDRAFARFAFGDHGRWAIVRRDRHVVKTGPTASWDAGAGASYLRFGRRDLVAWADGSARLVELRRGRGLFGTVFAHPADSVRMVRLGDRLAAQWVARGPRDEFGAITSGPSLLAVGATAAELADPARQIELAPAGAPGDILVVPSADGPRGLVLWADGSRGHAAWLRDEPRPRFAARGAFALPETFDNVFGLFRVRALVTADGTVAICGLGIRADPAAATVTAVGGTPIC